MDISSGRTGAREGLCPVLLLVLSSIIMCVVHSLPAGVWADFVAVNGDFQNYNVVRRFLNGQIVYADFVAYLGYGHLLLGSILTFIFGCGSPDFMSSKIAFQFAAIFSFALLVYTMFRAVFFKNGRILPLIAVNILLIFLLISPLVFVNALSITTDFYSSMQAALVTGNSARFLRGLGQVFAVVMIAIFYHIKCRVKYINRSETLSLAFVYGIPAGIVFYYSNDYGVVSTISISVLVFFKILSDKSSFFQKINRLYVFAFFVLTSFVCFGSVISRGHLGKYLSETLGTGGAQSWYYISDKSYFLWDLDLSFWTCIQLVVVLTYFWILLRRGFSKENIVRFGIPLFFNMTAYAAENEYKLLSGGSGMLHEVSYTILYLTFCAEACSILCGVLKKRDDGKIFTTKVKQIAVAFVFLSSIAWSISAYSLISGYFSMNRGEYVKNVGYFYNQGLLRSIKSTDEFMKENDTVFSTYASALETYRNQFQLSGIDYIIHVLGNRARTGYIKSFQNFNPDYVATIRETYNTWEYWVKNANWFFYRELYKNYTPIYANDYQLFWVKNRVNTINDVTQVNFSFDKIDSHTVKISISAPKITYGIGDVNLTYVIKKKNEKRSLFMFNKMVRVNNENASMLSADEHDRIYYLASNGDGTPNTAIGIPIINGHGHVILTSEPTDDTSFDYFNASLVGVYNGGYFNSVVVLNTEETADGHRITIANTLRNRKITENANAIRINGSEYPAAFSQNENSILIDTINLTPKAILALKGHSYFPLIQVFRSVKAD